MIDTINVSLPSQLKKEADNLVSAGHFASFSDLVRTAIRGILSESKYDLWAKEAMEDYKKGKSQSLVNGRDVDKYLDSVSSK